MPDPSKDVRQPVIILGMHRSGTTMLASLLDRLGLFQGESLEENHESTFFLKLNITVMRRIHAYWDHPVPMHNFFDNSQAVELTTTCLKRTASSYHAIEFLGLRRFLRHRSIFALPCPWGWKDPRTVFTLPLWLSLFPAAKLIYLARNGVDVAASLFNRERRRFDLQRHKLLHPPFRFTLAGSLKRIGYKGSLRCLTMPGAFSLWEEYVAQAQRQLTRFPNERHILSYEQFVQSPRHHLAALAAFCGLDTSDDAIAKAIDGRVETARAHAFVKHPEHVDFYHRVRKTPWMIHHGYDNLPCTR